MLVAEIEVGYILADLQHLGKLRQRYFRIFDAKIMQIFQFHNVAAARADCPASSRRDWH